MEDAVVSELKKQEAAMREAMAAVEAAARKIYPLIPEGGVINIQWPITRVIDVPGRGDGGMHMLVLFKPVLNLSLRGAGMMTRGAVQPGGNGGG